MNFFHYHAGSGTHQVFIFHIHLCSMSINTITLLFNFILYFIIHINSWKRTNWRSDPSTTLHYSRQRIWLKLIIEFNVESLIENSERNLFCHSIAVRYEITAYIQYSNVTTQICLGLRQQEIIVPWINSNLIDFQKFKFHFRIEWNFVFEFDWTSWIMKELEKGLTLIKNNFRFLSSFFFVNLICHHMDHEHICRNDDGFGIWIKTPFYFLSLSVSMSSCLFSCRNKMKKSKHSKPYA